MTVAGTTILIGGIALIKFYFKRKRLAKLNQYPENVVILHQFPHDKELPTVSLFCLKLETWLKVTNVKYQVRRNCFICLAFK